jgi:hypothetical protein
VSKLERERKREGKSERERERAREGCLTLNNAPRFKKVVKIEPKLASAEE